eukprot:1954704-Rhodomonas_salina.2
MPQIGLFGTKLGRFVLRATQVELPSSHSHQPAAPPTSLPAAAGRRGHVPARARARAVVEAEPAPVSKRPGRETH